MGKFEAEISKIFNMLEKNESTLIDQIYAYLKLLELSNSENYKSICG